MLMKHEILVNECDEKQQKCLAYVCPCCGEISSISPEERKYFICPVCKWENDPYLDEDGRSDANGGITLEEAKEHFFSAKEAQFPGGETVIRGTQERNWDMRNKKECKRDNMENFKIKGFSFAYCAKKGELAAEKARHSLDLLRETGTEWIALCVEQRVESKKSLTIRANYNRNVSDLEVVEFIRYAHEKGMKVCLKPMINCEDGNWRADINFYDDLGSWAKWFYEYEGFLAHYAEIAEYTGCELFCLGCEMLGMERQEEHWRKLIANIRKIYSGPLTYNTNHGHEMEAKWYDALDYVGTSAYFRMHKADGSRPNNPMEPIMDMTREDMVESWKEVKEQMRKVSEYWNKPVIFMEIGCRSARGTACQPWDFRMQFLPYDEQEQALFYDSCMEVFEDTDFFMGFFWWDWAVGVDESWAEHKYPGFSIYGKEAAKVLAKYYKK